MGYGDYPLCIVGTPKDVIAQIETTAELGINEFNLGGPLGPDPEEAIWLLGRYVLPYFQSRGNSKVDYAIWRDLRISG